VTIPFWSVLFIILIPFALALINDYVRYREFGVFDNNHPRQQTAQLTGTGARIWAAQENAWEALMIFVPSVLIAHAVGADASESATAAIVFCGARVMHSIFYICNFAMLRSLSYLVALGCCLWLFWLSATA
jgi:uncharacterized MAPEG superfamily protein